MTIIELREQLQYLPPEIEVQTLQKFPDRDHPIMNIQTVTYDGQRQEVFLLLK